MVTFDPNPGHVGAADVWKSLIAGAGCTVFVIVNAVPTQLPDVEVGVTRY